MEEIAFEPIEGALRFKDKEGEWICANPGDPLFSTVCMVATQYYTNDFGWIFIGDGSAQRS